VFQRDAKTRIFAKNNENGENSKILEKFTVFYIFASCIRIGFTRRTFDELIFAENLENWKI
jgi:hypothetical protein